MFNNVLKGIILSLFIGLSAFTAKATTHVILVWDGYMQFLPQGNEPIYLGDTIQWLPLDEPSMIHTITSTQIPGGAEAFDVFWQTPVDTFFQYIPAVAGNYNYICVPHEENGMIGNFTVQAPLGVNENVGDNAVWIYPNPTQDKLFIHKESNSETFRIFRINGQIIREGQVDSYIDVSDFAPGVYVIEFAGDRTRMIKFVKE